MSKKSKGKDAESVWQSPDMQALDAFTKKLLKVPKTELDKRLEQEREANLHKKKLD